MVRLSIISNAAGTIPAAMIARRGLDADSMSANGARRTSVASGDGRQPNQRLGDDAEHTLGADHGAGEVVAGVSGRATAGPDDAPVGQDDLQTENVIRGDAVLEAMRTAGVLGDVPADGAGSLARWIGREEEPVTERLLGELEIDHARFDQRGAVFAVDLEDAVHPRQADDDPALLWDRAAGETSTGAAGDHWQISLASQEHDLRHLLGCRREGDGAWGGGLHGAIDAAVVLVDEKLSRVCEDRVCPDDPPQLFDKCLAIHDGSHHSIFTGAPEPA